MKLFSGITARFLYQGEPANAAQVYFYETGTTNNKAIWTDYNRNVAADNPQTANANGEVTVWLDEGEYTVRAETAGGTLIDTEDGISSSSGITMERASENGASSSQTDAQNLTAIEAKLDTLNERFLLVDAGINVDYENMSQRLATWIFDDNTGKMITGNVAIESGFDNAQHITMRTVRTDNISQLWIMPRGDTDDTNQIAAVKIFGDDFEEEDENPTGEGGGLNYRDCALAWHNEDSHNGAGIALVNTKVNGDFIPVRGDGGLAFQGGQEIPLRWLWVQGEVAAAHNAGDRFYKFRSPSIWLSRFDYDQWDLCHVFGRVYEAQAAISAGGTKPVHTSGTTDDWKYLDDMKPSSGYTNPIPTIMIGDRTDEPLLPFPDVTLQCSMSMMMHYQQFIRFANNLGDEADFTIRRDAQVMEFLADTTSGEFIFQADETNNGGNARQLRVNNERVLTENLQFTVDTGEKPNDTSTTLAIGGYNHIAFNDSAPVSFTAFSGGRAGMFFTVRFGSANTTLVDSASISLPNSENYTPDAGAICEFYMSNGTAVQLVGERTRIKTSGITSNRPAAANCWIGREYFDTTLGIPIWYDANGTTGWCNHAGAFV